VLLHGVVSRLPERRVAPAVLGGFGLVRLLVEPLRASPPLGEPIVPAAWIAAGWIAWGGALAIRSVRSPRVGLR
jgi:hypothetical protein